VEDKMIKSPLTGGLTEIETQLSKEEICELYSKTYEMNIDYLLSEVDDVKLLRCKDSGYRFFYPYHIAGDGPFYEILRKYPWYYADWKWDYDVAFKQIKPNTAVLDIGCGQGKLLIELKNKKNCKVTGLELNSDACKVAQAKGIEVQNVFIQDHVKNNAQKYDYVVFFQVLEHIAETGSFLDAAINCLKPGGQLIIAVPNNRPYYLKFLQTEPLNWPPHHMGWWDDSSLRFLGQKYNLKVDDVLTEPLQHIGTYTKAYVANKITTNSLITKIISPFVKIAFYLNRKNIPGASICATYTKQ
jgi:methionine biosynthesis protein MetW